jgi:hypothetical protein
MTQMVSNPTTQPRVVRATGPIVVLALLGAVVLMVSAKVGAADKPEAAPPLLTLSARGDNAEDLRIEVAALTVLRSDPQLAGLNLYVRIAKGIVYLTGEVPSAELKAQAIRLVGKVKGVLDVRSSELYVRKASTNKRMTLVIDVDRPTQSSSASPSFRSGVTGPGTTVDPSQQNTVAPKSTSSGQSVTLLAPETTSSPTRITEPTRLTAHPRPHPPTASLATAVERVRQSQSRYQFIRTQIVDSTVRIYPSPQATTEDLMAFAQSVQRLPGVRNVVIENASSPSR